MTNITSRAAAFDATDGLAPLRDQFLVPDGVIYLDGNSLGLMPKSVPERLAAVASQEWAQGLIGSWSHAGWFHMPLTVGDRIAPLIGAGCGEVAVGDSTSVNILKGLAAALHLNPGRRVVLAEGDNFPTDSYIAQGLADLVPDVTLQYFGAGTAIDTALTSDVAVLLLSHVDYRTGVVRDMAGINALAKSAGVLVLWDLSHTTGAVHCDLTGAGAEIAVGCTYKYLNGGPGAPAFIWIHPDLISQAKQPLSGWMGHANPFDFARAYQPADGARRLVCGTPQILSLSALDEALKIWETVDRAALFAKSRALTSFFIEGVEDLCAGCGLSLIVPRDPMARGSHVSFDLKIGGFEVMQALAEQGVIGDFRAPGTMRFGFAPLYLSFADVARSVQILADILETKKWDQDKYRVRGAVT